MKFGLRILTALIAVASWFCPDVSHAEPPVLTQIFPAGGQRGSKVTATCTGKFAPWPVSVWSPGIDVAPHAEAGKLDITIPPDLAADRVWIRLYNAEGASAAVPFLIGSLKEINDQEPNNAPRAAQAVADPNVTINGVLDGGDVDGFAVPLAAGQTLVADVDGNNHLASPMDAVLQVASADGIVLAENHDDVELDPRLAFTAKTAGTYLVRLFAFSSTPNTAIAYQGGANFVYRLTLTTGPFITHAVPLSVTQAAPGDVEVFGWNLSPGTKLPVVPFGGAALAGSQEFETLADLRHTAEARLGFVFAPNVAGSARVRLVPFAVLSGVAQGTVQTPQVLTLPSTVTGRLRTSRQIDGFQIPLTKGQQIVIAAETRNLESPVQPVLRLTDPAGAVVAQIDDPAPTRAKILTHLVAVDGDHKLTVLDQFRQAGDHAFYRLTVRLEEPDFELSPAADALIVAADKPAELLVNVVRRAPPGIAVGPITIQAVDLPAGVAAPAVVSEPTGDTAAKVTLKFTTTGPAFSGRIRIQGTAALPKELTRLARTPPQFGACLEAFWLTVVAAP